MIQQFLVKDVFEVYGYFYIDDKTGHGFLIDPGAQADKILDIINKNSWIIEKILLTHGHFDHTGAVEEIRQKLGIPYLIHKNGARFLSDNKLNLSSYCKRNIVLKHAEYFDDYDIIRTSTDLCLHVIHTPGHTPDSVVFYNEQEGVAFVGDTIFRGSIGNTGYPGGNMEQLRVSIVDKIFQLPAETILYSGHSDMTTVGTEVQRYTR